MKLLPDAILFCFANKLWANHVWVQSKNSTAGRTIFTDHEACHLFQLVIQTQSKTLNKQAVFSKSCV